MHRNALRGVSVLGVFLILAFAGGSVYAGGRGGGRGGRGFGGGGGRSISRSGPTSGGSFGGSYSGGYGGSGSREYGGGRPSAGTLPADRGGRAANARERVDQQPSRTQGDRDQAREDRQQNRQENQ